MNYDHAYHAGNPADVVKHAALSLVLAELVRKDAPVHYLDTHAGAGLFPLLDPAGEWTQGIGRLWSRAARRRLPELASWLDLLGDTEAPLEAYPGSPALAQALLRPGDRLELCEARKKDALLLAERLELGRDRRVVLRESDGWAALAKLRVREGHRLLALIDPPFESVDEWDTIDEAVVAAAARPSAVIMLWYPIKAGPPHEGRADALRDALEQAGHAGLSVEVRLRGGLVLPKVTNPRVRPGLVGTGLLLLGAPGRAVARLSAVLPELCRMMSRPEYGGAWEAVLQGWG